MKRPLLHLGRTLDSQQPGSDSETPPSSVGRAVGSFVVSSLVAVVVFAIAAFFIFRDRGTNEAIRDAREIATIAGRGIVEPSLDAGILSGRADSLARLDRVVQERLLSDRVVRVKLWSRDGRILYSDEPRLIGLRYGLGPEEREAIDTGVVEAELSDLSEPENRFERGEGKLLEVYLPIRAPDGTPVLFEVYQRFSTISASGRRIWLSFAPALFGALLLLWLVQVPLAWSMAHRLRQSQRSLGFRPADARSQYGQDDVEFGTGKQKRRPVQTRRQMWQQHGQLTPLDSVTTIVVK